MIDIQTYIIVVTVDQVALPYFRILLESMYRNKIQCKQMTIITHEGQDVLLRELIKETTNRGFTNRTIAFLPKLTTEPPINEQRWSMIRDILQVHRNDKFMIMDADMAFLRVENNRLDMIDPHAAMTIATRYMSAYGTPDHANDNRYLNCGTIFVHDPSRMSPFFNELSWQYRNGSKHIHGDQAHFHRALRFIQEKERFEVQELHCRNYNCIEPQMWMEDTKILHFKSQDGRSMEDTTIGERIGAFFASDLSTNIDWMRDYIA